MESGKLAEPHVRLLTEQTTFISPVGEGLAPPATSVVAAYPSAIFFDCRGDLRSPVARQKVTFAPTRANTVRPYGRDKDFLFGLHAEVHFLTVTILDSRQLVAGTHGPYNQVG